METKHVACKVCSKDIQLNNERQTQFFCSKVCRKVRHRYTFDKGGQIIMNRFINMGNKYFFMNREANKEVKV